METMGERIRARRAERGWTLPRLSDEAHVAKGYLWELEADKAVRPSASTLFKLASALGTSVADLLGEVLATPGEQEIPESLRAFAASASLPEEDVLMLAGIHYRGRRPETEEDWRYVLESIRRSVRHRVAGPIRQVPPRSTWRSSVVLALLACSDTREPVVEIQRRARALLARGEQVAPPVDLALLASLQGVTSIESSEMTEAGRIVPTSRGLVIQVRSADSERRQRFTVAHEIGHTLFPQPNAVGHSRDELSVGRYSASDEEEYLCDVAASELLLPDALFRPRMACIPPTIASIEQLADEFKASLEATALRWARLEETPRAIAVWERSHKPAERRHAVGNYAGEYSARTPEKKFRISHLFRSDSFRDYIPLHKSVDDDSIIATALRDPSRGILDILLGGRSLTFECEAVSAPYRSNGELVPRVISLLAPIK